MGRRPHVLLFAIRLVLATALMFALPLSHAWWGHNPAAARVDGPDAFALLILFYFASAAIGLGFFVIASVCHAFLRRRVRLVRWIDFGLFVPLLAMVIWVGATATYSSNGSSIVQKKLALTVAPGTAAFDFADANPTFNWERVFVFDCYTPQKEVEKALGFAWPDYRETSIAGSKLACLVIFVKDKSVVGWFEQAREIELGGIVSDAGYSRLAAKFRIVRTGSVVQLLPS